ncbi:MAG: M55 family metallopeptidase [Fretibacterium sp.]|nr:M55 family metallopeptidase [Fretibacterium sp.]
MKIYICADMEGASGVVHTDQTTSDRPEYAFGCRMQLHDVNAVVEGLVEAGVKDILVNDAHARMINLDIAALHPAARLLSGTPKTGNMVEGHEGFDAALFVGFHAMAGTRHAILDHTVSSAVVYSVTVNGHELGETGLNAMACSASGVPTALVTGDQAACDEASRLLGPELVTLPVKTARGRLAADCLPPAVTAPLLRAAAVRAVEQTRAQRAPFLNFKGPFDLRLTFHTCAQCDQAAIVPTVERLDGRTLRVTAEGGAEAARWATALIRLASR